MKRNLYVVFQIAIAVFGLCGNTVYAAENGQRYKLISIGVLNESGKGGESIALAINEFDQVVGMSTKPEGGEPYHAFFWDNGELTDIGFDFDGYTWAFDVNDSGEVVGRTYPHGAFLWQDGALNTDLGTLRSAAGINNYSQIVGTCTDIDACLWEDGVTTELGTLGGDYSYAEAINDNGRVVGTSTTVDGNDHAFLWENGIMTDLGALGGDYSYAEAINDHGQVVGRSRTVDGNDHAFLWENGIMIDLDSGDLGVGESHARGINSFGQVVGYARGSAFIWDNGVMTDLNDLVYNLDELVPEEPVESPSFYRWEVGSASDINDFGQIVGWARNPSLTRYQYAVILVLDSDGDRITDDEDACPYAGEDGPCGGRIKSNGCPVNDVDGDEICNDQDRCKWSGDGIYGIKYGDNSIGCPLGDADVDTIADIYDRCTWRGDKYGLGIRRGGCPSVDSDGDGMPNHLDYCAWQNPGDRFIKPGGCKAPAFWNRVGLVDQDSDGIPHKSPNGKRLDACPWRGDNGLGVKRNGCPIEDVDSDRMINDGMRKSKDACDSKGPTEEFGMTGDGCPIGDRDDDGVPDPQDNCADLPGIRLNQGCPL